MQIGRRIYYDLFTGEKLVDTGQKDGPLVVETTLEQDFARYLILTERNPDTVGMIQLEYGQYADDFAQSFDQRVDPVTQQMLFSYADPSEPEQPPVYRPPLSEQVDDQNRRLADVELALADIFTGGI